MSRGHRSSTSALYRLLLRMYPADFRSEHGDSMHRLFLHILEDERARRGRWIVPLVWMSGAKDCIVRGAAERMNAVRRRRRSNHRPRSFKEHGSSLLTDIRQSTRALWRRPALSLVSVATLALGIGATTAIFSVVNGILLRPLPYPNPERLVTLTQTNLDWRESEFPHLRRFWDRFGLSYPVYEDWLNLPRVFDALGAHSGEAYTLTGVDRPERLSGVAATFGLFDALGVPPLIGRVIRPDDDRMGAARVTVLSYATWQRSFGGDSTVVGRAIRLNDEPHTVIGVMPPEFGFPGGVDVWATLRDSDRTQGRGSQFLTAIARLKPEITLRDAIADMKVVTERIREANPGEHDSFGFRIIPRQEELVGNVRVALTVLLGAVGMVLLIACANIANLLLVRATERRRELAVRSALGAGRLRLTGQVMSESILLSLAGGVAGVTVAVLLLRPLAAMLPPGFPRSGEIAVDATVLLFAVGLSLLTGLVVGCLPALGVVRTPVATVLQDSSRGYSGGRRRLRTQSGLVVAEVAVAFVLLVGAGVLVKSYLTLMAQERGFDSTGILTMQVEAQRSRFPQNAQVTQFHRDLIERLEAIPGVLTVGGASSLPFSGSNSSHGVQLKTPEGDLDINVARNMVSGDYFRAMGMPVLAGRGFVVSDDMGSPDVAVINRAMADAYWPNSDPSGWQIERDGLFTIVGVVGNVKHRGLHDEIQPKMYYALAQHANRGRRQTMVVRTAIDPLAVADAARQALWQVDSDVPVASMATMDTLVDRSVARPKFQVRLLGSMAALAGLLALIGTYSVMTYAVTQRTQELGIRLALGARRATLVRGVLTHGMRLAALGLTIGVAAALASLRVLEGFVYKVSVIDTTTFIGTAVLLAAASLLASYVPAMRAARVDPMTALRSDA